MAYLLNIYVANAINEKKICFPEEEISKKISKNIIGGEEVNQLRDKYLTFEFKIDNVGNLLIDGRKVKRTGAKSGGFIYEDVDDKNLWIVKGRKALPLRTTKGQTGEGLAELQDILLQGGIKDARYYLGDVGKSRKAYFIEIPMTDGTTTRLMLDGKILRKVDPKDYHFLGAKLTKIPSPF